MLEKLELYLLTIINLEKISTKRSGGDKTPPKKMHKFFGKKKKLSKRKQKYSYAIFDLDNIHMSEADFINHMASQGWDLFLINNEPLHQYPRMLVKLYFRKELSNF